MVTVLVALVETVYEGRAKRCLLLRLSPGTRQVRQG